MIPLVHALPPPVLMSLGLQLQTDVVWEAGISLSCGTFVDLPPFAPGVSFLIHTMGLVPMALASQGFPCPQRPPSTQQVLPLWQPPDGDGDLWQRSLDSKRLTAHLPPDSRLPALHHGGGGRESAPLPAISPLQPPKRLIAASHGVVGFFPECPLPLSSLGGYSRAGLSGEGKEGRRLPAEGVLSGQDSAPGSACFQNSPQAPGWV